MLSTVLTKTQIETLYETYKHLHRNPELSMQEHRTAEFIEERLSALGVDHFRCGGTGVVGILTNGEGPIVAFRADTDGLPIEENTGVDYASTARGTLADGIDVPVMHGCGHDTHVAVALSAVEQFIEQKNAWVGTIVWIFQPGEETAEGAAAMVADGLWDFAPRPEVILGQHVGPFCPTGGVGIVSGTAMSMADSLRVTVWGKQSHGSQPQDSIDPIVLGAHIVTRLQTIISRELSPQDPAVITCGTFHSGLKENIIPDRAEFTLNIRTMEQHVRGRVLESITRIINAEAAASGAPAPVIDEIYRFPVLHNDPDQTVRVKRSLELELGDAQVHELEPAMGSEDLGWLAQAIEVPNVYWFFGAYSPTVESPAINHSPFFLPEIDPTLVTGVRAAIAGIGEYVRK